MIIVLAHTRLGGSDIEWQGFGRELSRTGVEGNCRTERSHKQRQLAEVEKSDRRLTNGGRASDGLRRTPKQNVTVYSKSVIPQVREAMGTAWFNVLGLYSLLNYEVLH